MFEREFEIIVPQNFEICLERIDTLKMPGCLSGFFQSIDAFVYLREYDAQFVLRQSLGKNAGYAVIKGNVEPLDEGFTRISGMASLESIVFIMIFFSLIAVGQIFVSFNLENWGFTIFVLCWYPLAMYQFFFFRNRLIKVLQKALEQ